MMQTRAAILLPTVFLALSLLVPAAALAQMHHAGMHGDKAADAAMSEGEIRRIDKDQAKLTIKHGPIQPLDMPAMTMVFGVKERGFLDKVAVGDKVRFAAAAESGRLVVTAIEPAR